MMMLAMVALAGVALATVTQMEAQPSAPACAAIEQFLAGADLAR